MRVSSTLVVQSQTLWKSEIQCKYLLSMGRRPSCRCLSMWSAVWLLLCENSLVGMKSPFS